MNDTEPVVIVSADSHVGPRLAEELRPYCPLADLEEFDGLVGQVATLKENIAGFADFLLKHPNFKTAGHHDSAARLADYDYDGVAAGGFAVPASYGDGASPPQRQSVRSAVAARMRATSSAGSPRSV